MVCSFWKIHKEENEDNIISGYNFHRRQVELETALGVDTKSLPREKWDTWDPTLISEVMMMVVMMMVVVVMMVMMVVVMMVLTMYTYSEVGYPAGFQL